MDHINLYIITLGGMTLGGFMAAIARDAAEGKIGWLMFGMLMLAGLAIMYGVTQLPDLGG